MRELKSYIFERDEFSVNFQKYERILLDQPSVLNRGFLEINFLFTYLLEGVP